MSILSLIKSVSIFSSSSLLREIFIHRFIPSEEKTKQISDYLLHNRKELKERNASILEQKLTLLQVPYLKYLDLSQIDHWEKNFSDDPELLLDLYVAQGVMHKGLKRIIWDENSASYHYINQFTQPKTCTSSGTAIKLVKNKITTWTITIFSISLILMLIHKFPLIIEIIALIMTTILLGLILFSNYRDLIVSEATERIINKYPELIQGYEYDLKNN
ncbi:hypothetical protein [Snodgrassella alvi]|uniref:hypothetical protein n=1 Tax=Snodgrassella alvi TaxID=1196083 RepID=UPI000C1DE594|nr:hypothetical protein [Snodgrassella alvi]PIT49650.1 hypothetical protein BHC51_02195 [Snodgrassella alvi]